MTIEDAVAAVKDFHMGTGSPVAEKPRLLPGDRLAAATLAEQLSSLMTGITAADDDVLLQRAAMAIEEQAEWLTAHAKRDLIAVADAWADRAYMLLGDAVASGLPAAELFAEVHRSNMTKDLVADGTGKATKGANYRPPNLAAILESASNDR